MLTPMIRVEASTLPAGRKNSLQVGGVQSGGEKGEWKDFGSRGVYGNSATPIIARRCHVIAPSGGLVLAFEGEPSF